MPVELTCRTCGEPYSVKPSQVKGSKYCSIECKHEGLRKSKEEREINAVEIVCQYCGKSFEVEKYRELTAKYCSKNCADKSKIKRHIKLCPSCGKSFNTKNKQRKFCSIQCAADAKKLKPKKCLYCGEWFSPYKSFLKYCSVKCATSHHSGKNNGMYKGKKEFKCEWCGKKYKHYPSREGRTRFCSKDCRAAFVRDYLSGETSPFWKGGALDSRGVNWGEQREKALKRDGYVCQKCGLSDECSLEIFGYSLSVHHIKKYRSFNGDYERANRLENLITLCIPCHMVLERTL